MQNVPPSEWGTLYIEHQLPWEFRLFYLYLIVICVLSLVKTVSLTRRLWSFTRGSLPQSDSVGERSGLLVASALASGLSKEASDGGLGKDIAPQVIRDAENKFLIAWEACSARVQSMKRLVMLTFLLSFLVAANGARTMLIPLGIQKATGVAAYVGGIVEVLTLFVLGTVVCAALYAACSFYEEMLTRRKAAWSRFLGKIENRLPDA
jgi:hypothetical protein